MSNNPAVLVCILCGIVYIISAWIMMRYPPKKINDFYGYRTNRSKKSQEHWDFAQIESAKYMKQSGYYSLICCTPFMLLTYENWHIWIAIIVVTLLPFVAIFHTEKALKNRFDT